MKFHDYNQNNTQYIRISLLIALCPYKRPPMFCCHNYELMSACQLQLELAIDGYKGIIKKKF